MNLRPIWDPAGDMRTRQELASRPDLSAWVSANAGSGKTTVLVRRVLRLLLDGVDPGRILCLTYTKAAAANMSNRLFGILSRWATLDDASLEEALVEQIGGVPRPEQRVRARRLFAYALETPGGLSIETIHAFCTRMLQSAPFEAGVPAHFEVISDTDRAAAIEDAVRRTLSQASGDAAALKASLDRIAREVDETRFREVVDKALAHASFLVDADGAPRPIDALAADLRACLGLSEEWTEDGLFDDALRRAERLLPFGELCAVVQRAGTATLKRKFLGHETGWPPGSACAARFAFLWRLFETKEGKPANKPLTQAVIEAISEGSERIAAKQNLIVEAAGRVRALRNADRSLALFRVAREIFAGYLSEKQRRGALDYGDLVDRARRLLAAGGAPWVLYKLDAGLDHLLVDEAQDTSPEQWSILNALTEEFHAGHGQRSPRLARTVFAVGDDKQSIFGFQGAVPAEFGRQRRLYQKRDPAFELVQLNVSFRSSRDVIEAVDRVFALPDAAKGLSSDPGEPPSPHETNRRDKPEDWGSVDLWDLVAPEPAVDDPVWQKPIDALGPRSPERRLAEAIAQTIHDWTEAGRCDLGRPFVPGDVLILLPRRNAAFEAIVRALKDRKVPVAGIDRLKLAAHIAVEDMAAIARAALLPEDDLAVATALKTPIFGLDDDDLLDLAPRRAASLREALAAATKQRHAAAHARLSEIEALVRTQGPFAFFTTLLSAKGGRRAMLARLGPEAGDALDAFLQRALEHERLEGPCIDTFLERVAASSDEVKRDLAEAGGEVRVMTVHGAKGLEAKVVFIADVGARSDGRLAGPILSARLPEGSGRAYAPVWVPKKSLDCPSCSNARTQRSEKEAEESNRLLYVAMTRAADRLVVCGVRPGQEAKLASSWYEMIEKGLGSELRPIAPGVLGIGRRRFKVTEEIPAGALPTATEAVREAPQPPAWLSEPAPPEAEPAFPLAPSRALSAAQRGERGHEPAALSRTLARGRFVHKLLQWLPVVPEEQRKIAAERFGQRFAASLSLVERRDLIGQTLAVMDDPEASILFRREAVPEAEIGGMLTTRDGLRPVAGRIDRLVVLPDRVVFADFKTTQRPPAEATAIEEATLGQLAVYRDLLGRLNGGRPVTALAIYTAGPLVLAPPAPLLDAALARITGL